MTDKYLTRSEARAYIKNETGVTFSKSSFDKAAPEPDAINGKTHLYLPPKVLAWARNRIVVLTPKDEHK
jgi:hypothetical protein